VTAAPRPAPGAAGAGTVRSAPDGAMADLPRNPAARPHILVVNGRKVHNPVFILGAPCSGTHMLARALKRSAGFHVTLGQRWVVPVVQAFARTPSLARRRPDAAATVLRDAFAQGWQLTADSCLGCTAACQEAGGMTGTGPCVAEQGLSRFGDASPELLYCAESLVDAFPDARLVQIVRDGRDVVAAMLRDPDALAWFRPGFVNLESDAVHPLLGIESPADRQLWASLHAAGRCAMRWRGTVRLMARLRTSLTPEQLITLRYEDVVKRPAAAAAAVSSFLRAEVAQVEPRVAGTPMEPGAWRKLLTPAQVAAVERVAGSELRRVGYGSLGTVTYLM
jgi:Sulfotransferase family